MNTRLARLARTLRTLACSLTFFFLLPAAAVYCPAQTGQSGAPSPARPPAEAPAAATGAEPNAAPAPAPKGFLEIVFSGGLTGMLVMLALIGLSLTAAYLVFDQLLTLRRGELLPEALGDTVRQLTSAGRYQEASQACQKQPCLLSFVLLHGIEEVDSGWSAIEKAVEDALAEQSARLFRKVEYLSVIGNIAPMLGLLGTVMGMIFAFERVATTQGAATAGDLAEGIYQALVTTVAGLVIAIPALGAFAVFRNRVDELIAEAAYLAQHALAPLKRPARPAAQAVAATPRRTVPPPPPAGGV